MLDKLIKLGGDHRVSVPSVLLAGLVWLGYKADDLSVQYLSEFFVTKAEAQSIGAKVDALEKHVANIDEKLDEARVSQIEALVFQRRIEQCMATGTLKNLLSQQLADLVAEWRALTGQPGGTPTTYVDCGDLG